MLKALKRLMKTYRSERKRKRYLSLSRDWLNVQIAYEKIKPEVEKWLEEAYRDYTNHTG